LAGRFVGASAGVVALVCSLSQAASATTRYSSGTRAQLEGHVGAASATGSGFVLTSADVMAAAVALMMVCALGFMVITFVRRRLIDA
jgi:hypothetical protein